jgi:hypothetical protein
MVNKERQKVTKRTERVVLIDDDLLICFFSFFLKKSRKYIPIEPKKLNRDCRKAFLNVMASSANEEDAIVCCEGKTSSESIPQLLLGMGLCSEVRTNKNATRESSSSSSSMEFKKFRFCSNHFSWCCCYICP